MQLNKRTACPYPFFLFLSFLPSFFFLLRIPLPCPFNQSHSYPDAHLSHLAQSLVTTPRSSCYTPPLQLLRLSIRATASFNSLTSGTGPFFPPLSSLILAVAIAILFVAGFTRVFAGICRSSHMIDSGGSLDWMTILYVS